MKEPSCYVCGVIESASIYRDAASRQTIVEAACHGETVAVIVDDAVMINAPAAYSPCPPVLFAHHRILGVRGRRS